MMRFPEHENNTYKHHGHLEKNSTINYELALQQET